MSEKCSHCGQDLPDIRTVIEQKKYMLLWDLDIGDSKVYDGFDLRMVDKNTHEEGNWSTTVFFVVEHDGTFYKKQGEEVSHSGLDWDAGVREVFPKERTVIEYD